MRGVMYIIAGPARVGHRLTAYGAPVPVGCYALVEDRPDGTRHSIDGRLYRSLAAAKRGLTAARKRVAKR